jgi:hypothetical protein
MLPFVLLGCEVWSHPQRWGQAKEIEGVKIWKKGRVFSVLNYLSIMPWRRMGESRYSSTILDLGISWEWSASHPCDFTPAKKPPVPYGEEAGWATEPVWTAWRREKSLAPVGNRTLIPSSLYRYTDWAIPALVKLGCWGEYPGEMK